MTKPNAMQYSKWLPMGVFGALTWIIMAPLLVPGFVFALDMVPTPEWRWPTSIVSSYPLYALLHILNYVLPGDVLQKLLLAGIFFGMGLGAYALARQLARSDTPTEGSFGAYVAGLAYVVNPYVYSRLMAGQYAVLFGYALLPWFVRAMLRLLAKPDWRQAIRTGLWAAAIGIVSLHSLGLVLLIAVAGLGLAIWRQRHNVTALRRLATVGLLALGVFAAVSSFWLVPLAAGKGTTAAAIQGFNGADQQTFATLGDSILGRLVQVGRLEGFWVEDTGLYRLPQAIGPIWWIALALFLSLVAVGIVHYWRTGRRGTVSILGVCALVAALLASGVCIGWLSSHIALFAGYREPHKFTGLVALFYALCAGSGAVAVASWTRQHYKQLVPVATVIPVLLPFGLASSLPLGGGLQLTTSHYPAGWYSVNGQLNQDPSQYKVLFLPWHLYMHFEFAGTIMANPAHNFFDKPVLVSNDPEFGHSSSTTPSPQLDELGKRILPQAAQQTHLGHQLAPLNIKYVILANEADAEDYAYLDEQKDLKIIYQDEAITLYQNTAWQRNK